MFAKLWYIALPRVFSSTLGAGLRVIGLRGGEFGRIEGAARERIVTPPNT